MRWPAPPAVSDLWTRQFHVDLRPLGRIARERPEAVVLGLGVALRVVTYLLNRAMWLDEGMLRGNVVDVPILAFSQPLKSDQLAPFGFLIVERTLAHVLGSRNHVLRLPPLAAGIAALFLFRRLATRLLPRRAALVALVLFALSDDLIYYASEFKPYSLDLLFGVAITLAATSDRGGTPPLCGTLRMAALVVLAPWFSFASAFVIAGCGAVLLVDAIREGRRGDAAAWAGIGLAWLASFRVSYRASKALLGPATGMYQFWDFAFLPAAGSPLDRLSWAAGLLLEVFVNPLNLLCPWRAPLGVILPLALLAAGVRSMARSSGRELLLLVSPIPLAILATVLRFFPFHGRLILELVPAFFLLIAAGTEWIAVRFPSRSGIAHRTVLLALLACPCWDALYESPFRRHRDFNIHGDLHRNVFIDRGEGPWWASPREEPVASGRLRKSGS